MLYINVPFKEKDEAKSLGAKWDSKQKSWYVRDERDYPKFQKWIEDKEALKELKSKNSIYFNDEDLKFDCPSDEFMEDMAFDSICCESCYEDYVIREGKEILFFGCSNFPDCKKTSSLTEIIYDFFSIVGVNVYKWKRKCWKCNEETDVYSYFLNYELRFIDDYLENTSCFGLGDIKSLDEVLAGIIPSIKKRRYDTSNYCIHCDAIQGKNYVVIDPHEIYGELFHEHTMNKFFYVNININKLPKFRLDLDNALKDNYERESE